VQVQQPAETAAEALELPDVQGLVLTGYGSLRAAAYVLLEIADPARARAWLGSIADEITPGGVRANEAALNVAFTAAGLRKLGLGSDTVEMFSAEFVEGMVSSHRSRLLGDVEESAPERWDWGGPATPAVDVLLMVFARDAPTLAETYAAHQRRAADGGLVEIAKLDTGDLDDREHFGFRDGISQPVIAGSGRTGPPLHTIQPGEFVFGYRNEHGQVADGPTVEPARDPRGQLARRADGDDRADLATNGSYLVFRQLRQDVPGFWHFVDAATRRPDGGSDPTARTWLAAKMVGRWPSGAPLALAPQRDDPALANSNDFGYHAIDPNGFGCPIAAHVRRANPRDSLEPGPGTQQSIDVGKRHRLLRRGREYGRPVEPESLFGPAPPDDVEAERGLHFVCLCANIARQFEFIQHTWVASPKFDGLYDDSDPLIGVHGADDRTFTVPADPVRRRFVDLPRFVTVRGGAYFFLPGLRALRYLAGLAG
jgi:Dyp-type peroxidase family